MLAGCTDNIPLPDCPSSVEGYYQEDLERLGMHYLYIGFAVVYAFAFREASPDVSCFIFLDSPIGFSFDYVYPFGVHDLGPVWDGLLTDPSEYSIIFQLESFLLSSFCLFSCIGT